MVKDRGIKGSN